MPRLPDITAIPDQNPVAASGMSALPSESFQANADAKLGAAVSQLGNTIAGPVATAVQDYQKKGTDLQEAQATAYLQSNTIKNANALSDETDADAAKTYGDKQRSLTDDSAALISDPTRRELWKLRNIPQIETMAGKASDKATAIQKDAALGSSFTQLQQLQQSAGEAKDDESKAAALKSGHALIDQLESNGYITAQQAAQQRQQFANGYALTSLQALPPGERLAALNGWEGALINKESSGNPAKVNSLGFAGLYQMGAPLLQTLGIYTPGANEKMQGWQKEDRFAPGKWSGTFNIPGFPGVKTLQDFLGDPAAQKAAFAVSKSYYDGEIADRGLDKYIGKTVGGVPITRPGLYSMMHLGGVGGAQNALETGGGSDARDANGSSVLGYAALGAKFSAGGTPSLDGLKIKSGESTAGGDINPGTIALARTLQDSNDVKYFSAFNDTYHKGTNSDHAKGLAFDLVPTDPSDAGSIVDDVKTKLLGAGLVAGKDFQVINEYDNPSERATGGHVHVAFKSPEAAAKYANVSGAGASSNGESPLTKFLTPAQKRGLQDGTDRELVQQGRSAILADRQESSTVKGLLKDDENSIMTTGQPVADLTPERVSASMGPEAAQSFVRNRQMAIRYHDQTSDFDSIPSAEIVKRVNSLAPSAGQPGFTEAQAWHATAQDAAAKVIKQRQTDPAAAVANQPDVQAASQNASLDNPETFAPVAKARLAAQDRIGISDDLKTPITRDEARQLYRPIATAAPDEQLDVLKDTIKQVRTAFGDDADTVLQTILKEGHADKSVRETTAAVLKRLARGELPSQSEARAADEAARTAAAAQAVAPLLQTDPSTGLPQMYTDPTTGAPTPLAAGQTPPAAATPVPAVRYPSPSVGALQLLKGNPALAEQFDQRYGPGAAKKAMGVMGGG